MNTTKVTLYEDGSERWRLLEGDAQAVLALLPPRSVDAVICDPPYALGLAGEAWDRFEATGPGSFQAWTKAWAKQCLRILRPGGHLLAFGAPRTFHRLVAGIEDAGLEIRDQLLWLYGQGIPKSRRLPDGQGTTLKPAHEPIILARAPLDASTIRANVARWGTGALNIDVCRIARGDDRHGYWPANVTYSHSPDCPASLLEQPGTGPSRLFYCAKASRAEREAGGEALPARDVQLYSRSGRAPRTVRNPHLTVKPTRLMAWLIRLTVPTAGIVLDPFAGSGSTGLACLAEGRMFIGIEREPEYADVACARLHHHAMKET